MSVLIQVVQFLFDFFRFTLRFMLGVPGMIVESIVGLGSGAAVFFMGLYGKYEQVMNLLGKCKEYVQAFNEWMMEQEILSYFYDAFAIDTFMTVLAVVLGVVLVCVGINLFNTFFNAVCIAVPFLIFKAISRILRAMSLGTMKV